jgi:hypothetical protein
MYKPILTLFSRLQVMRIKLFLPERSTYSPERYKKYAPTIYTKVEKIPHFHKTVTSFLLPKLVI